MPNRADRFIVNHNTINKLIEDIEPKISKVDLAKIMLDDTHVHFAGFINNIPIYVSNSIKKHKVAIYEKQELGRIKKIYDIWRIYGYEKG